jgi:molybdopterin converting factor small subunit
LLPRCRIAVRQEFAEDSTEIRPNDELAVIPPVSGG